MTSWNTDPTHKRVNECNGDVTSTIPKSTDKAARTTRNALLTNSVIATLPVTSLGLWLGFQTNAKTLKRKNV